MWSPSMAGFVRPSISGFSGTPERWNGYHGDGTNSHTAVCHYATIILLCLIGNSPPACAPAGRLETRARCSIPEQCPVQGTHVGSTNQWMVRPTTWTSPSLWDGSQELQRKYLLTYIKRYLAMEIVETFFDRDRVSN